jgi:hypothetical protein
MFTGQNENILLVSHTLSGVGKDTGKVIRRNVFAVDNTQTH